MRTHEKAPLFDLGACVATPGAIRVLKNGGGDWRLNAAPLLARHQDGNWGDVPVEDARQNELSLEHGWRIISSYEFEGERLWIITEGDRSSTCVLRPEEY